MGWALRAGDIPLPADFVSTVSDAVAADFRTLTKARDVGAVVQVLEPSQHYEAALLALHLASLPVCPVTAVLVVQKCAKLRLYVQSLFCKVEAVVLEGVRAATTAAAPAATPQAAAARRELALHRYYTEHPAAPVAHHAALDAKLMNQLLHAFALVSHGAPAFYAAAYPIPLAPFMGRRRLRELGMMATALRNVHIWKCLAPQPPPAAPPSPRGGSDFAGLLRRLATGSGAPPAPAPAPPPPAAAAARADAFRGVLAQRVQQQARAVAEAVMDEAVVRNEAVWRSAAVYTDVYDIAKLLSEADHHSGKLVAAIPHEQIMRRAHGSREGVLGHGLPHILHTAVQEHRDTGDPAVRALLRKLILGLLSRVPRAPRAAATADVLRVAYAAALFCHTTSGDPPTPSHLRGIHRRVTELLAGVDADALPDRRLRNLCTWWWSGALLAKLPARPAPAAAGRGRRQGGGHVDKNKHPLL
eukprot:TRINITY_DN5217_c0_g1_i1.p1 TRINITY_DN5217_c0_g1~~TRINITY_DN5217_c0_g1_i1.p1  ORF type:complete len:472 (+),score=139.38 TRINITY_DN5217_c0_g1_i1:3-1418(+)